MYMAYTPIQDNFTSLALFRNVYQVAHANILPKDKLGEQPDDFKMIIATSRKNAYYFDYTSTPMAPVEAGSRTEYLMKLVVLLHFRTILMCFL